MLSVYGCVCLCSSSFFVCVQWCGVCTSACNRRKSKLICPAVRHTLSARRGLSPRIHLMESLKKVGPAKPPAPPPQHPVVEEAPLKPAIPAGPCCRRQLRSLSRVVCSAAPPPQQLQTNSSETGDPSPSHPTPPPPHGCNVWGKADQQTSSLGHFGASRDVSAESSGRV